MKPEGCSQVNQIERPGSGDDWHRVRLAKVKREIAQEEEAHVLVQAPDRRVVLLGTKMTLPDKPHQIPFGFHDKEHA